MGVLLASGLEESTTGFAKLSTTQQTHKQSVLFHWHGGSTSQSSLTSSTRSSSSFARSLTTCPTSTLFITAACPSSPGSVPSTLGEATPPSGGCGTPWCMSACTPTTSWQHADQKFRSISGG